jgi:asparagine synthase (glutamine-hydrolysing)
MVGICGIVGDREISLEPLVADLQIAGDERCDVFREDGLAVAVASHPQFHTDQPARTSDGALVWVHGEVYGSEGPEGYEPRTDLAASDARYCADRYEEAGLDFVSALNGEFAGVVFEPERRAVHLFTDRIGSVPLFYTRSGNPFLFSSRLQSIGLHPGRSPRFDREYLAEFFSVLKTFGTATPLADVRKVGPASILTVGLDESETDRRTYWRPEYRPVSRSPDELAARFTETLQRVFTNRLRDDLEYGVLLSGGSDSRLVLAATMDDGHTPTAFHLTNWMSREAQTTERVATVADVALRFLRRGPDYHADLLETVPGFADFVGTFDEFIASGFPAELGEVDVLLSGYLGDTMFGDFPIFTWGSRFPFDLPVERAVGSVDDYVERYLDRYSAPNRVPDFLDAPDAAEVVSRNIRSGEGGIVHHGVRYRSLRELQLCEYYPLTNQFAYANSDSLRQIAGHWSPFFDNRLIDLHLTVLVRQRLHHDIIADAMCRLAPELAAIPHSGTGVPPRDATEFGPGLLLRRVLMEVRRRAFGEDTPASYLGQGPWMDEAELIRTQDFIEEIIDRNRDCIRALPFLDEELIERSYREHLDGADNWRSLYALATFLESPLARRVAAEHRG